MADLCGGKHCQVTLVVANSAAAVQKTGKQRDPAHCFNLTELEIKRNSSSRLSLPKIFNIKGRDKQVPGFLGDHFSCS